MFMLLNVEIEAEKDKQEKAVEAEDFWSSSKYKTRIAELGKENRKPYRRYESDASVNDVAESVERMTGIPVSQMGGYGHRTFERYGSSFADEKLLVKIRPLKQ